MNLGLNAMNKQELRAKLAEDAKRWEQEHGQPERIAAVSSPQEHFRICGSKYKRKVLKERDVRQELYQEWLEGQKQQTA